MPARSSVYSSPDHATFRDLNIFEERLKETAAGLQRRKSRYQFFLAQLLVVIALLLVEVLLPPDISILSIPYKIFLCWLIPEVYDEDDLVILHPYFTTGLLFVSVTTLVLFFASGMYSEKIAYANKYVPHTNRALRSFNMFFNTRQPSLRSKFLWNPLFFFFPRPKDNNTTTSSRIPSRSPSPVAQQQHEPQPHPTNPRTRSQSSSRPIPSIPPATNPRGELIFSSRVDRNFREGYDRYRAAFEKKREEAIRQIKEQKWMERWWWLYKLKFWETSSSLTRATTTPSPGPGFSRTASNSSSTRGRTGGGGGSSRSGTPPTPGSSSSGSSCGITMRQRDRSGSPMRPPRSLGRKGSNRRIPSDGSGSGRRDISDEGDMRMQALERSLAQGSPVQ